MNLEIMTMMKKSKLIEEVTARRSEHVKQYKKALVGWRTKMARLCAKVVEKADKLVKFPKALDDLNNAPRMNTEDFDNALKMLELTQQDEIELTQHDFEQLVLGQWDWATNWAHRNSRYGSTGATGPTGDDRCTGVVGSALLSDVDEIQEDECEA